MSMNTAAGKYGIVDVSSEENVPWLGWYGVQARLRKSCCGTLACSGTMFLYSIIATFSAAVLSSSVCSKQCRLAPCMCTYVGVVQTWHHVCAHVSSTANPKKGGAIKTQWFQKPGTVDESTSKMQGYLLAAVDNILGVREPPHARAPDDRVVSRWSMGHLHGTELQEWFAQCHPAQQHLPVKQSL